MNTVINEQDGKYIVSLEGELDTAHALEVKSVERISPSTAAIWTTSLPAVCASFWVC